MLFNIEEDHGDHLRGYIVPDGFSSVPSIRVLSDGVEQLVFDANEIRTSLVDAGRHETGRCGFSIDRNVLPALPALQDLELYEVETGILIYRRAKEDRVRKKILRLETHLFPLWSLDTVAAPRFQYFSRGIESYGRETITQMFLLNAVDSVYVTGKIFYKNFEYFIDQGFQTIIVIQNPYEELAERLLVLSKMRKVASSLLGLRESSLYASAMAFAETLAFDDDRVLKKQLLGMPGEVAVLLANPVVRQLTTSTPDEMPVGGAVAGALDILSTAVLVGRRNQSGVFLEGFAELLGLDAVSEKAMTRLSPVPKLARMLEEGGFVDALLERDLELYHFVDAAANKAP